MFGVREGGPYGVAVPTVLPRLPVPADEVESVANVPLLLRIVRNNELSFN